MGQRYQEYQVCFFSFVVLLQSDLRFLRYNRVLVFISTHSNILNGDLFCAPALGTVISDVRFFFIVYFCLLTIIFKFFQSVITESVLEYIRNISSTFFFLACGPSINFESSRFQLMKNISRCVEFPFLMMDASLNKSLKLWY